MVQITRRLWIKSNLAIAAAAGAASSISTNAHATRQGKLKLSMVLGENPLRYPERVKLCQQIGITHVVSRPPLRDIGRDKYAAAIKKHQDDWAEAGFTVSVYEGFPTPIRNIMRFTPGREEEIVNCIAALNAMGKVCNPMPVIDYDWAPGWYRSNTNVITRGGAITTEFDYEEMKKAPLYEEIFTEDQMWDSLTWFLERVIPVAEKANVKMGLHPADPPISPVRGTAMIMRSSAAYRRLFNIVSSPSNGATFCQGNFRAMTYPIGEDIYSVAREFSEKGKINYIHFRDVEGTAATKYIETFHDNGPTDMPRMLEIYARGGFNGPVRPDHAPTMEGEDPKSRGYAMLGKLFAFGYMKGMMDALNLAYE